MKIKIFYFVFLFFFFWSLFNVNSILADETSTNNIGTSEGSSTDLPDPLGGATIPVLVGRIIEAVLGVVGSLSLLMFVYGGITWMTSGGSPEKIKKGKDTLAWSVVGLVLIFSSYAILKTIFEVLTK